MNQDQTDETNISKVQTKAAANLSLGQFIKHISLHQTFELK